MGTNQDYKNRALASLEGKWGKAVVATFIYYFLTMGLDWVVTTPMGDNLTISYSTSGILTLVFLPLGWGFIVYFLNLIRFEEINYSRLFDGYKDILRIFLATFLSYLVIVIGLCLLIVPGIILATGLLMTDFILKDDPEISAIDAMAKSWKMTNGHKAELFYLFLSFIGWIVLSLLTLGVGFLILSPYMQTTLAHYYEDLKEEQGE
jgi:uncharacterized membrane protein